MNVSNFVVRRSEFAVTEGSYMFVEIAAPVNVETGQTFIDIAVCLRALCQVCERLLLELLTFQSSFPFHAPVSKSVKFLMLICLLWPANLASHCSFCILAYGSLPFTVHKETVLAFVELLIQFTP